MSAYACDPNSGSESAVGFGALHAAASRHEVWLLTRDNNLSALSECLADSGIDDNIHLEGLDIPGTALRRKSRGLWSLHRYYDLWQRAAGKKGLELHSRVRFNVVHHVTFASYWTRTGVAAVPAPLVWGPVGGGVSTPPGLFITLGSRGMLEEAGRALGRRLGAVRHGAKLTAASAAVTLAQNWETARKLEVPGRSVEVMPNATVAIGPTRELETTRTKEVLLAGRLIPLKGAVLAVRALRYVEHPAASLVIAGDGPDKERVWRLARRWGLAERVSLTGNLPRETLLRRMAVSGVLLHPSLHEEGGLAVAEALGLATPVVCLDRGGPRVLASLWPEPLSTLVSPTTPDATARRLAGAIDDHLYHPPRVSTTRHGAGLDFKEQILSTYERAREAGYAYDEGYG